MISYGTQLHGLDELGHLPCLAQLLGPVELWRLRAVKPQAWGGGFDELDVMEKIEDFNGTACYIMLLYI